MKMLNNEASLKYIVDTVNQVTKYINEVEPILNGFKNMQQEEISKTFYLEKDVVEVYKVKTPGNYLLEISPTKGVLKIFINSLNKDSNFRYELGKNFGNELEVIVCQDDEILLQGEDLSPLDTITITLKNTMGEVVSKQYHDAKIASDLLDTTLKKFEELTELIEQFETLKTLFMNGLDVVNHSQADIQALYAKIKSLETEIQILKGGETT